MTEYLLDTNHAGALMRDDPRIVSAVRTSKEATFHLAMPSVGELRYMVYNSARVQANSRKLKNLLEAWLSYHSTSLLHVISGACVLSSDMLDGPFHRSISRSRQSQSTATWRF